MISMNFLNLKVYLSNQIVEQFCGLKPVNFEPVDIASDPNFVFENDPNFSAVNLYDAENNTVIVNSYLECKHYVEGGWNFIPNVINEVDLHNGLLFISLFSLLSGVIYFYRKNYES